MTILHSQCLATELVKTTNAVAINSVAGPVTGVIPPVSAPATGASSWYIDTSTTPDSLYFWNGSVWSLAGDGTSALLTQDEGVALGTASTMNFVGGGVTATYSAGVTTVSVAAGAVSYATNAEAQAGTSAVLSINPANLYARENIAAQTGVSNNLAAIAAPTAGQSNWAVNLLGETLHYAPGVGWRRVANHYVSTQSTGITALPHTAITAVSSFTVPSSGVVDIMGTGQHRASGSTMTSFGLYIYKNGVFDGLRSGAYRETVTLTNSVVHTVTALGVSVVAGDIIELRADQFSSTAGANQLDQARLTVAYAN